MNDGHDADDVDDAAGADDALMLLLEQKRSDELLLCARRPLTTAFGRPTQRRSLVCGTEAGTEERGREKDVKQIFCVRTMKYRRTDRRTFDLKIESRPLRAIYARPLFHGTKYKIQNTQNLNKISMGYNFNQIFTFTTHILR
jgi:hypothetical protein